VVDGPPVAVDDARITVPRFACRAVVEQEKWVQSGQAVGRNAGPGPFLGFHIENIMVDNNIYRQRWNREPRPLRATGKSPIWTAYWQKYRVEHS
jgi:hypothetical protein